MFDNLKLVIYGSSTFVLLLKLQFNMAAEKRKALTGTVIDRMVALFFR